MKLYLIRHAETVDNVAGLYAGVRDSKLTVHGTEQARRLGELFARNGVKFTFVFCSPLTRTTKTAEALLSASSSSSTASGDSESPSAVDLIKCPELIEQNFGFYEGKPFRARIETNKKTEREADTGRRANEADFQDVESREAMAERADGFLTKHLLPIFETEVALTDSHVAIVSHGMLLSTLWRRILLRFTRSSLSIAPEVTANRGPLVLEHLGGWSNTGYLELRFLKDRLSTASLNPSKPQQLSDEQREARSESRDLAGQLRHSEPASDSSPPQESDTMPSRTVNVLSNWSAVIMSIDNRQHLQGLKRQRGGIGSIAADDGQKKLDTFFSKRQRSK